MKLIIEPSANCLSSYYDANMLPLDVHNISPELEKNPPIGSLKNSRWRPKLG